MKEYDKLGELRELKNYQRMEELLLQLKMLSSEKNALRVQNQANERRIRKRNERIIYLEKNLRKIKDKLEGGSETVKNNNQNDF